MTETALLDSDAELAGKGRRVCSCVDTILVLSWSCPGNLMFASCPLRKFIDPEGDLEALSVIVQLA
jgi:hypothetical protein